MSWVQSVQSLWRFQLNSVSSQVLRSDQSPPAPCIWKTVPRETILLAMASNLIAMASMGNEHAMGQFCSFLPALKHDHWPGKATKGFKTCRTTVVLPYIATPGDLKVKTSACSSALPAKIAALLLFSIPFTILRPASTWRVCKRMFRHHT